MTIKDYKNKNTTRKFNQHKKNHLSLTDIFIKIILIILIVTGIMLLYKYGYSTGNNTYHSPIPEQLQTKDNKDSEDDNQDSSLPPKTVAMWQYIQALENRKINAGEENVILSQEQKELLKNMGEQSESIDEMAPIEQNDKQNNNQVTTNNAQPILNDPQPEPTNAQPILDNTKPAVDNAKPTSDNTKPAADNTQPVANNTDVRFGLQCGSFTKQPLAEELYAKLLMHGLNYEPSIKQAGQYYKIMIGPVGNRQQTSQLQKQLAATASCIIITM